VKVWLVPFSSPVVLEENVVEDATFTEGMMKGPEGEILRFFYTSARNDPASNAEGRAIFDTVLMVDVITPGQKASTPCLEIERVWAPQSLKALGLTLPSKKSHNYQRFAEQIDRFKRNETDHEGGGMPLKMWPRADRGLIATLNAQNIFTVEQLASISDASLDHIGMGARELREQAKAYLQTAFNTADLSGITARVSELETENRRLQEALAISNNQAQDLQRKLATASMVPPTPASTLPDITL
jgi:hypothetical protein